MQGGIWYPSVLNMAASEEEEEGQEGGWLSAHPRATSP